MTISETRMGQTRYTEFMTLPRLFGPIGHIPPAEAEANYYAARQTLDIVAWLK